MTIDEVKHRKQKLRQEILALLQEFEADTGLRVNAVDVDHRFQVDAKFFIENVRVSVSIP